MDWKCTYTPAPGFSFRREGFGGILFHFEGDAPDPRLYFIDSPFLIDLLYQIAAAPLDDMMGQAEAAFGLTGNEVAAMRSFFRTLVEKEALVPQS